MAQKVSKKIANAIEYVFRNADSRTIGVNIYNLVFVNQNQLSEQAMLLKEHYINSGKLLSLLDIIANGYEIEETPEEKVLGLYERATCLKTIEPYRSIRK
ncbi:hypothetical protein [Paenibacillus elgii]|uniref:hypothetical protein n=1 Tax=Paenibacillus elgii TaxID=189691 RepID=UPI002040CFF2|nr:hypothetical protein [Paenibacillus elgii]MCM3273785.1 hypothetical protein [Paenibacillus elgii]